VWAVEGYYRKARRRIESWTLILLITQMNRREHLEGRIKNLKGLIEYLIRIGERDTIRGVRETLSKLDRELEGMKRLGKYH
jgi:hypothetical protein